MRRLAVAAAVALAALAGWVGPASAHAELTETSPRAGEALRESPAEVLLTFTEEVNAVRGGVRIYDARGERVDRAGPVLEEGHGKKVLLDLPPLRDGAYIVTWRVASADSHPVRGAFTFRVGDAPGREPRALAARLLAADGGDPLVGALHGLARFAELASLLVLVGALWFAVTLGPVWSTLRGASVLVGTALATAALASLALLALQGPYTGGLGVGSVGELSLIGSVLRTRFGLSIVARLAVLSVASYAASRLLRPTKQRRQRSADRAVVAVLAFGLIATVSLAGHAATGRWVTLGLTLDVVHLAAAALWLGGLLVAVTTLRSRTIEHTEAVQVVGLFSRVAAWAVLVVLGTGMAQSLRQVGEVAALTGTTYGRLLLVKVGAFAVMVLVAAGSRRLVARWTTVSENSPVSRLRRSAAVEVALAVLIVGATALLINAVPARDALALPFATEARAGPNVLVDISVEPAKAGPLDLHLYTLAPAGTPLPVAAVDASLSLRGRDIGPLVVPIVRAGPNHFASYDFDLPVAGRWVLSLVIEEAGGRRSGAEVLLPIR